MKCFFSAAQHKCQPIKILRLVSALALVFFAQTARADVITTTTSQPYAGTGFASASVSTSDLGCCTFNQFDSSLGTLTNVTVDVIGSIFGRPFSEFYPVIGSAEFSYALYLDVGGTRLRLDGGRYTLPNVTLSGPNSVARRGFFLLGNANSAYSPELLSSFIGPGTFDLTVVVDAPRWNGVYLTAEQNGGTYDISGQIQVHWRYDTSTATNSGGSGSGSGGGSSEVPSPSAFLVMSLGLISIASVRRKRKHCQEREQTDSFS